jgi:hypothetical protein
MKTQAKSAIVVCEYCNKEVRKRGLVSHIRLLHNINVAKPQVTTSINPDYGKALKELDKIERKIKKLRKQFIRFQHTGIQVKTESDPELDQVVGEILETAVQPVDTVNQTVHSYTTEDVQILMGKIFVEQKRFSYLTAKDPFLQKELEGRLKNIISDFETRFNCKYKDLQKEYPDYQPTKNPKKWKNRYIQLSWFSKDDYSK